MRILIVNGPNLNLLGKREPGVYGQESLENLNEELKATYPTIQFDFFQSNLEGELVNIIQKNGLLNAQKPNGIIINPGGYSHTSVAIADAIAASTIPVVEVHISNIHAREEFRHTSITGSKCSGIITGFGKLSYWLAVEYIKIKVK